jgi:hypothetical protein
MKLILITLVAVVVGMMVACAATPAIPANTPNIDGTVEAAIAATKTAEQGQPNLTDQMLEGVLEQFYLAHEKNVFESGAACLMDGELSMHNRMWDFKKTFDPKKKEWEIQVTGRYCKGIEFFYINDVTGKLSR